MKKKWIKSAHLIMLEKFSALFLQKEVFVTKKAD